MKTRTEISAACTAGALVLTAFARRPAGQLERAVEEAMRLLKAKPVRRMMTEPPPPTHGKRTGGGS